MIIVYYALTLCAALIAYPVGFLMALFGRTQLLERLNSPSIPHKNGSVRVWIHAASVGESVIAFSMAEEIKKTYTDAIVFVSTVTTTGLERIRSLNDSSSDGVVDSAFLAPLDSILVTGKFIDKIKPTSFILVETEIWPSLIGSLKHKGIPITIIIIIIDSLM